MKVIKSCGISVFRLIMLEAPRPDLVVVDKKERICKIIDFAVPGDSRIEEKEKDRKISRLGKGVTEDIEC